MMMSTTSTAATMKHDPQANDSSSSRHEGKLTTGSSAVNGCCCSGDLVQCLRYKIRFDFPGHEDCYYLIALATILGSSSSSNNKQTSTEAVDCEAIYQEVLRTYYKSRNRDQFHDENDENEDPVPKNFTPVVVGAMPPLHRHAPCQFASQWSDADGDDDACFGHIDEPLSDADFEEDHDGLF